ncbi:hypothetical protein F5Y14DRAFT_399357 [Nemania sp. NC0429]|nr:hypothetical protein F5Y14DRAFT_399357 [Nemania sp. NC0429]
MERQAQEPDSIDAAPEAGTEEGPKPGPSRKKAARRGSLDEIGGRESVQKRRRRAFSCLSCQKLKCRCEYDPGAQGCHRCQTLRIVCSLRGQNDVPQRSNSTEPPRLGVEERLQRHEDALGEIKTMIQALASARRGSSHSSRAGADSDGQEESVQTASRDPPYPEYLLNPVDRGSKSAPIVVLREISEHVTLGYRRMIAHMDADLVQTQLLDKQTASELIELFIRHQGHTLLVCSHEELRNSGETLQVSPFLRSVCCMIGIVYRDDICGTQVHRQVYEQVRITLGQALLCSPLELDDLNAMFILSNNATAPSSQGIEYIDSWLLTGYCVKQAMLSIYFTQIVDRVKKGKSTIEDHRGMHLWSTICLHHLHWAATTGRPSIIPKGSHINQCNVLLSFYQATMQDEMLVAEIMLYSTLHQKLLHESYPSDGRECEEFRTWKQRWNHLLTLPTSSMLRIGYHTGCLILAVRALGKTGEAPESSSLLSTDNTPATGSVSGGSKIDDNNVRSTEYHDSNWAESETARDKEPHSSESKAGSAAVKLIRENVCKYARLVVETFLEMPRFVMDGSPTCTALCVGYCALVLAHYDSSESQIPDATVLRLITRLQQWIQTSPDKAWSFKYGKLAIRKVEARIRSPAFPVGQEETDFGHHGVGENPHTHPHVAAASENRQDAPQDPPDAHVHVYSTHDILGSAGHAGDPDGGLPPFDLGEHAMFPSMEGFFGGGFLDFMR